MKKLSKEQKTFAINALRRGAYRWWGRYEARKSSWRSRGKYECASCNKLFGPKQIQMDHIKPVIPLEGYDSLDGVASRMLVEEEGWQTLCIPCHRIKSNEENKKRI